MEHHQEILHEHKITKSLCVPYTQTDLAPASADSDLTPCHFESISVVSPLVDSCSTVISNPLRPVKYNEDSNYISVMVQWLSHLHSTPMIRV